MCPGPICGPLICVPKPTSAACDDAKGHVRSMGAGPAPGRYGATECSRFATDHRGPVEWERSNPCYWDRDILNGQTKRGSRESLRNRLRESRARSETYRRIPIARENWPNPPGQLRQIRPGLGEPGWRPAHLVGDRADRAGEARADGGPGRARRRTDRAGRGPGGNPAGARPEWGRVREGGRGLGQVLPGGPGNRLQRTFSRLYSRPYLIFSQHMAGHGNRH